MDFCGGSRREELCRQETRHEDDFKEFSLSLSPFSFDEDEDATVAWLLLPLWVNSVSRRLTSPLSPLWPLIYFFESRTKKSDSDCHRTKLRAYECSQNCFTFLFFSDIETYLTQPSNNLRWDDIRIFLDNFSTTLLWNLTIKKGWWFKLINSSNHLTFSWSNFIENSSKLSKKIVRLCQPFTAP